jgi:hypothetical protein
MHDSLDVAMNVDLNFLTMFLNPNHAYLDQRETKKNKMKREAYVSKWPYLQILAYAISTLPKWFETITKLNLTLNKPKTMTFGQRKSKEKKRKEKKMKNPNTCHNGHL